jgi:hypothetical protein
MQKPCPAERAAQHRQLVAEHRDLGVGKCFRLVVSYPFEDTARTGR